MEQNVPLCIKQKCGAKHQMHVAEATYEHMAPLLSNLLLIVSTFSTGIFRYIFGSFSNKWLYSNCFFQQFIAQLGDQVAELHMHYLVLSSFPENVQNSVR